MYCIIVLYCTILYCTLQYLSSAQLNSHSASASIILFLLYTLQSDIWNNNYLVPTLTWDQAPTGEGTLVRQVLMALQPNINLLAVSPIYTVSEDGATGSINFCVKISLYTKDRADMVNFK
jgi:Na+-translocating ferredoxin:NAD+ oxidoreductase RnfG subunit